MSGTRNSAIDAVTLSGRVGAHCANSVSSRGASAPAK